ncbi:hypothetical protein C8J57DRAFT_1238081 [Mycena rebaudengoi]|nr:hypothetical protein C8J57DRAFT_1238081 [Mycena rebaudengoi]
MSKWWARSQKDPGGDHRRIEYLYLVLDDFLRHWGKKETIFFVNQEYSVVRPQKAEKREIIIYTSTVQGWGPSKGAITGHEVERRSEKPGPGFDRTTLRSRRYKRGRDTIYEGTVARKRPRRAGGHREPVVKKYQCAAGGARRSKFAVADAKWKEGDGIMSHVTLIRIWTIRRAQARLGCAIKVTGNDAANWRQAALWSDKGSTVERMVMTTRAVHIRVKWESCGRCLFVATALVTKFEQRVGSERKRMTRGNSRLRQSNGYLRQCCGSAAAACGNNGTFTVPENYHAFATLSGGESGISDIGCSPGGLPTELGGVRTCADIEEILARGGAGGEVLLLGGIGPPRARPVKRSREEIVVIVALSHRVIGRGDERHCLDLSVQLVCAAPAQRARHEVDDCRERYEAESFDAAGAVEEELELGELEVEVEESNVEGSLLCEMLSVSDADAEEPVVLDDTATLVVVVDVDVSDAGLSFDVGAGGVELEESLLGAGVAAAWATLVLVEEAFPSVSSFVSESSFISSASLGLWHGSQ